MKPGTCSRNRVMTPKVEQNGEGNALKAAQISRLPEDFPVFHKIIHLYTQQSENDNVK